MDDKVRFALRELVTTQGEAVLSARERLRGLLSDEVPECNKEINVLMIAVQAQVPAELRTHSSSTEPRIAVNSSIGRLQRAFSLDRSGSTWAVLSIAYALNRVNEQQFQTLLRDLSTESNITPPIAQPPERQTEPFRPAPAPAPPPPPPPIARPPSQAAAARSPRPISQPAYQPPPPRPTAQLPYQPPPVSPTYPQPYANQPTPVYSPAPQMPVSPTYPPQPVQPERRGGSRVGIGIAIGLLAVLLVGGGVYALAHRSSDTPDTTQTGGTQPGGTQSGGGQTSKTSDSGINTSAQSQSDYLSYSDTSGLFQVEVPRDWMFKRSESDTTLDNAACHLVRAALFPKDAEHADLNGWISAGVRISVYLPANGTMWQPEWAEDWQKRTFNGALQGYTKVQNTNIEPVQLGNLSASTTAVMGEAPSIAEPEVARLYVGTNQKYLVVVDVAMPSSRRPIFEAEDEKVRKTFELKVQ